MEKVGRANSHECQNPSIAIAVTLTDGMQGYGKLEIHVPETFSSERPSLGFHHDTFDISIEEHPLASKLTLPVSDEPFIQEKQPDIMKLGVPAGTPLCLNDYLESDHPQLTLHVVSFTDATLVSICGPHIAVDAMSLLGLGVAWSLALVGRESEIPPMLSAGEDPMGRAGQDPAFSKPHALEALQITGWRLYLFLVYYLFDLLWWRVMTSKTLFLPRQRIQRIYEQAKDSLSKTPNQFISEGDAIVAWLSITIASAYFPNGSNRPLTIGNAYDLRGRAPSIFPVRGDKGTYVQNAVFPCWTIISTESVYDRDDSTLGNIALAIRNAIQEQTTEDSIHAQARLTRESLELSGIPPVFGDPKSLILSFTNVSKAKVLETINFEPAIVHNSNNQSSASNKTTSKSTAQGHPVYYHNVGVSPDNLLGRNLSTIDKSSNGDYWIRGNYPPEVWKIIESMI
ncbi:putative lysr family regulatory protein [Fusarium austroafricanum]|uniref:Putative lysr family regulatory protein n=1 Tax=Fusarium austroafricanum TaxID=2364996 RepID=A0A8H4KHV1_9HYPO|nr:putative lysr family regulatory protein [Fusarium austroafricanum]